MHHFFQSITNTKGDALIGYYVQVTDPNNAGAIVSMYADTSLTPIISVSGVADKAKVDADGDVNFYVQPGSYDLRIFATNGTTMVKTISNVAMNSDISSASATALTRTALAALNTSISPAFLVEAGRDGTFVFDSSNNSANVTADPNQALYVAPASDATGASGAWVRKYTGPAHAKWWGGTWDGVANDGAVVLAAYATLFALSGTNLTGDGVASPSIKFPFVANGIYMGTNTVSLTKTIATYGENGGTYGGHATVFKFDVGCNGFEVRAQNCYFDGIALKGGWTGASTAEGEYQAIKAYYKFGYGRLYITGWQGDGIHADITAGSGGDTEGNCNGIYGQSLSISNCRNGIYQSGVDVNGGWFGIVDVNFCRRAGVYSNNGFGNGFSVIQAGGNGVQGITGTIPTCVFNNGHIFTVVRGQATGASTNSPPSTATSNAYWLYWKDAGAATSYAPQWVNATTYRDGGAIITNGASNCTTVEHLYSESDQPPLQTEQATLVKGGELATGSDSLSRRIWADSNGVNLSPNVKVAGSFTTGGIGTVDAGTGQAVLSVQGQGTFNYLNLKCGASLFTEASIYGWAANGVVYDAVHSGTHFWKSAGADAMYLNGSALNLSSGWVLKVNNTQVVGARQTGTATNASDLASAIALVNDLKAKLITHGLIS